jgi:hypothetical protein
VPDGISDKYLEFAEPAYYDRGEQTSVALHSSGLVIEFRQKDLLAETNQDWHPGDDEYEYNFRK